MNIFLTGGTGAIGRILLDQLVASGHAVTALVRSDTSATRVAEAGAVPLLGDITDVAWLTEQLRQSDAAVHTASPGDATSESVDRAVAQAVVGAYDGSTRPYVHTGGAWVWGSGADLDEDAPFAPPALTAWRAGVEQIVLDADVQTTIVAPGIVYGYGQGIPNVLTAGPRTSSGALTLVGGGEQHWTTIHVDDLANLYATVVEQGSGLGYLMGVSGVSPTVRELGEAFAGPDGVEAEPEDATRARLGAPFAEALLLDQVAAGAKARSLGWHPVAPTLVEELAAGEYRG